MRNIHRVTTAFEHRRAADRQPAGHYGKLRDWQIAEAENDEAALSLFCLASAGAATTQSPSLACVDRLARSTRDLLNIR
jgi:hypothetical protein